ncbi:MAG TPA: AraC family transcriptional regulator [Chryseosolibacter sp.]|nr:AraC family transcriptional regulator [Chryseosolibacter sp.]
MVLQQFPDLQWLKNQAEQAFRNRKAWNGDELPHPGWPTVMLNVRTSDTFRDQIRGPVSIFTNISGESHVEAGGRRVKVSDGMFFVTNHDQYYTLAIEQCETETFNIHFGEYFADQVFAAQAHPDKLLDNPVFSRPHERIEFLNTLHQKTGNIASVIRSILQHENEPMLREEHLVTLMLLLINADQNHRGIAKSIPAIKQATRTEIVRRLLAARDYLHSHYHQDFSLDELAAECCLSKFHFLRLFKLAFNKTPHQFLNEIRIERAKTLLKDKKYEIRRISPLVGIKDAASFSRLFHKHTGVYPSVYRQHA